MVAGWACKKPDTIIYATAFGIFRPVIEPSYAGKGNGCSAHRAGLEGHIKICADQPLVIDRFAGLPDCYDFSVKRRVVQLPRAVSAAANHDTLFHHNSANWHFAALQVRFCLRKCQFHEPICVCHMNISLNPDPMT